MNDKIKKQAIFVSGVGICAVVAILSIFLEELIPGGIIGASIIALFMGKRRKRGFLTKR